MKQGHGGGGHGGMSIATKGVETLLGNPKKAIIKLSIPMIIAMAVQTIYNFADGFWVAGINTDALAAVGFFFPFFMLIMGVAMGVGMGGGAAISRRIGAKDKPGADNVAVHTIVLMFITTVIFMIPALIFAQWKQLLSLFESAKKLRKILITKGDIEPEEAKEVLSRQIHWINQSAWSFWQDQQRLEQASKHIEKKIESLV